MKKIIIILLSPVFILLFVFGVGIVSNNCCQSDIDYSALEQANEKSIEWLVNNQDELLSEHNAMLWWFLSQAVDVSGDQRITAVLSRYKSQSQDVYRKSPWNYLVNGYNTGRMSNYDISTLPDYNQFFIYSFSCDKELAQTEIIKRQHNTDFCSSEHPISPACVTHQLMSFRFMQRTRCEGLADKGEISQNIETLLETINYQLIFDFRVVDVYLQRILMLADSGRFDEINPVWINNAVDAQLDDGGWGDFDPLIAVSSGQHFGFTSKFVAVRKPKSTFHATAQGIWLTTLLLSEKSSH